MTLKKRPTNDPPPTPQHTHTHTHTHTHFSGEWENWFTKNQYIEGIVHKRRGRGAWAVCKINEGKKEGD